MGKHKCQRTLYASACSNRTSAWSPVSSSSGGHSYLWGTTPWFLKGSSLSAQSECLCHKCAHSNGSWADCACQSSTSGGPPNQDWHRDQLPAQRGWVLEALDLQGLKEWPESEQKQARELLLKWEHLFAHSNLDLGKTALTKHKITLTDQMPFKEHY